MKDFRWALILVVWLAIMMLALVYTGVTGR